MSKNLSLNIFTFHEYSGNDPEKTALMAQLFIEQCAVYIRRLNSAYHDESNEDWHNTAHGFKGMAAFAGAEKLHHLCIRAQNNYHADLNVKKQILDDISIEVTNTTMAFANHLKGGK